MNLSGPPGAQVDMKDPRIRYTFADVAMKLANDGPMYVVLVVILVLSVRGTTSALESVTGMAIALLARSRPPDAPDKATFLRGIGVAATVIFLLALGHLVLTGELVATVLR